MRDDVRAALVKWREVLAGLVVIALALWLDVVTFGFLRWLAVALGLIGAALVWTGIQRERFRRSGAGGGGGAGIVQIDERRLVYMGPLTGGVVDLDDLDRLDLDRSGRPAHWLLTAPGGPPVAIPVDAEGADALLDAFAALPGLRVEAMLAALGRGRGPAETLWRRQGAAPMPPRLVH